MELSMRIKENIAFDSVGEALKKYASIELLLYQNKIDQALISLESFAEPQEKWMAAEEAFTQNLTVLKSQGTDSVLVKISGPLNSASIMDDVYWLEANIRMKRGEFTESILLLQKIVTDYPEDVLADDAFFLEGDIYERQIKDKDKAMEIYREFLNKFPGSVFAAEARKRFRTLRGDFGNQNP